MFDPSSDKYPSNFSVHLHRGIERTALHFGNVVEVNDIILFPDGTLCYDWDKSCVATKDLRDTFRINSTPWYKSFKPTPHVSVPAPNKCCPQSSCGSSGCGGRTYNNGMCGGYSSHC